MNVPAGELLVGAWNIFFPMRFLLDACVSSPPHTVSSLRLPPPTTPPTRSFPVHQVDHMVKPRAPAPDLEHLPPHSLSHPIEQQTPTDRQPSRDLHGHTALFKLPLPHSHPPCLSPSTASTPSSQRHPGASLSLKPILPVPQPSPPLMHFLRLMSCPLPDTKLHRRPHGRTANVDNRPLLAALGYPTNRDPSPSPEAPPPQGQTPTAWLSLPQ